MGVGSGERVEMEHDVKRMLAEVAKRETVVIDDGKSRGIYQVDEVALVNRSLGLTGDAETVRHIAREVPVKKFNASQGKFVRLSERAANDAIPVIMQDSLTTMAEMMKRDLDVGDRTEALTRAAAGKFQPTEEDKRRGITWRDYFKGRAKAVSPARVAEWRKAELTKFKQMEQSAMLIEDKDERAFEVGETRKLQKKIKSMGRKSIQAKIAQEDLEKQPRSAEWFATAIGVRVEAHTDFGHERGTAHVVITDPSTGVQRKAKIETIRDLRGLGPRLNKSDAVDSPELPVLEAITKWPHLMEHIFASGDPMRGGSDFEAVLRVAGML
jgi:hypothetical protein